MARIWQSNLLDDYDYHWMFPVHDESVHAFKAEEAAEVLPILHSFMVEKFLKTVPSESSVGIGKNYGQLIESEFRVYDPKRIEEVLVKVNKE